MLALVIASASGASSTAAALLSARGLIFDAHAEKRVIVSIRSDGMPDHFDFVGLVRDRNEELQAPDAVSRFILRLDANGVLSVLERQQDSKPDPQKLKFGD
jgi:hypothetical protein